MRIIVDLPEESDRSRDALMGFKSETDAVVLSLHESVRRRRVEARKAVFGTIELDVTTSPRHDVAAEAYESEMIVIDTSIRMEVLVIRRAPRR